MHDGIDILATSSYVNVHVYFLFSCKFRHANKNNISASAEGASEKIMGNLEIGTTGNTEAIFFCFWRGPLESDQSGLHTATR